MDIMFCSKPAMEVLQAIENELELQVQIWTGETDLINTVDIVFISRVD